MQDKKERTYLPPDEAKQILSGEAFSSKHLPDEEWQKMKPILDEMGCLKEENVIEGE